MVLITVFISVQWLKAPRGPHAHLKTPTPPGSSIKESDAFMGHPSQRLTKARSRLADFRFSICRLAKQTTAETVLEQE